MQPPAPTRPRGVFDLDGCRRLSAALEGPREDGEWVVEAGGQPFFLVRTSPAADAAVTIANLDAASHA